jgi:hypothetical protein
VQLCFLFDVCLTNGSSQMICTLSTAAEYSLALLRSYFCTLSNIIFDTNYNRGAESGHHGIEVSRGRDNLVTDCIFKAPQVWLPATAAGGGSGAAAVCTGSRSACDLLDALMQREMCVYCWCPTSKLPDATGGMVASHCCCSCW